MEYVNAIIMVIGFIIIFFYQKQKIGSLEKQLNSQKDILGNTKAFFDLFNLDKLKGYNEIVEKKIRMEMEYQIEVIKKQFEEEQKKHKDAKDRGLFISGEFIKTIVPFLDALLLLPRDTRTQIINKMDEGILKTALSDINKREDGAKLNTLLTLFAKKDNKQGS